MSYVQAGFVGRQQVSSQSSFYDKDNKSVVCLGGTYKCPVGSGDTSYSTFRGRGTVSALGSYESETSKTAYIVDHYKMSWSSDVMSYGTSDFDCYRLQMRLCTFEVDESTHTFSLRATHEFLLLNTLPNQVNIYEGKCPIAIPVRPGQCFGVQLIVTHVLGSVESISTATFNMVVHLTVVDETVTPNPYPW